MGGMRDRLEARAATETLSAPVEPRAFPVNRTASGHDIEITLLSFTLVEDFARLTGLVRLSAPTDVRLATVPALSLVGGDGPPLEPVSAHVLPQGALAWVSWLFRSPAVGTTTFDARIERVDLAYQIGKRPPAAFTGPWIFHFDVVPPTVPVAAGPTLRAALA
jgi:hypothetical protein